MCECASACVCVCVRIGVCVLRACEAVSVCDCMHVCTYLSHLLDKYVSTKHNQLLYLTNTTIYNMTL